MKWVRQYGHQDRLPLPADTHFTSPIRRYADDVVHKLILSALATAVDAPAATAAAHSLVARAPPEPPRPLPPSLAPSPVSIARWHRGDRPALLSVGAAAGMRSFAPPAAPHLALRPEAPQAGTAAPAAAQAAAAPPAPPPAFMPSDLAALSEHMNKRNQAAKEASWACNALFLALYFRARVQVLEAVVSRIAAGDDGGRGPSVQVFIPHLNVTASLRLTAEPTGAAHPRVAAGTVAGQQQQRVVAIPLGAPAWTPAQVDDAMRALEADAMTPEPLLPFPVETAEWLRRVPLAQRRALVAEGAVRVLLGAGRLGATAELSVSGEPGSDSCSLAVRHSGPGQQAPGSPPLLELRALDRVVVALYCSWDASSARRPPLVADLVASTPAIRALGACPGGVSLPASSAPKAPRDAQLRAGSNCRAAAGLPVHAAASVYGVALGAEAAALAALPVRVADVLCAGTAAAGTAVTQGTHVAPSLAAASKRARATGTAASAANVSVTRGRTLYGGCVALPLLRPHEIELRTPDLADGALLDEASALMSAAMLGAGGDIRRAMAGAAHPKFNEGARASGQHAQSWGAGAADAAAAGAKRLVFGGSSGYGADRRLDGLEAADIGYEGLSAYGSRVGEGISSGSLVNSASDLGAATRAAMARAEKVRAERRNDRMDKKRRTDK